MTLARCGSRTSSESSASTNTCTDLVERGPAFRGRIVFTKIRRCPLCMLTNADVSPLSGMESIPGQEPDETQEGELLQWSQGTSFNPIGRMCKICSTVFYLGGFMHRHKRLKEFLSERKDNPNLMAEWQRAWQKYVEESNVFGGYRMGKRAAAKRTLVETAKKVSVYRKAQNTICLLYTSPSPRD